MPRSPASPPYDLLLVATPSSTTAWDRATSATATAPDLSAALAALSPRPCRNARVLVASATLFTQRVRLDPARAAALAPAELESALFYEVEPFCGIPRAAAIIAIDPLSAGEWRVAVADRAELSALRDRVRAAGCRFAGARSQNIKSPKACFQGCLCFSDANIHEQKSPTGRFANVCRIARAKRSNPYITVTEQRAAKTCVFG